MMDDEQPRRLSREEKMARASRADQLLRDDMLQEAVTEAARAAHRSFASATTDEQLRRASDFLEACNYFTRYLRAVVREGATESAALKREREMQRGRRVDRDPLLREVV